MTPTLVPEMFASTFSYAIRRVAGSIVLTVQGDIDEQSSWALRQILVDLIDGQGNLSVLVDLAAADLGDAAVVAIFRVPVGQALRRRAELTVLGPPRGSEEALAILGLGEVFDDVGRRWTTPVARSLTSI